MKIYIDNRLIQKIKTQEITEEMLLQKCSDAGFLSKDKKLHMSLSWNSLFEYLDLHGVFEVYPDFKQDPFYNVILKAIEDKQPPEILMDLYDQLFAICLTEVKALKVVNHAFLLEKIDSEQADPMLHLSLNMFKMLLTDDPYRVIHELTLYLGFDRMCVALSTIFEEPKLKNQQGLKVLMDCLIESFQHIRNQGTAPLSYFRLIETLYAYEMRDENLDKHSEEAWATLSKASQVLKPRDQLIAVEYIDQALREEPILVLTSDSEEKLILSLNLVNHMIESHSLNHKLNPISIVHIP